LRGVELRLDEVSLGVVDVFGLGGAGEEGERGKGRGGGEEREFGGEERAGFGLQVGEGGGKGGLTEGIKPRQISAGNRLKVSVMGRRGAKG
jgi:hypothetical protein